MLSTTPFFRWLTWHTLWRGTAYVFTSFLSIFRPLVARLASPPSLVDVENLVSTEGESQKCLTFVPTGDRESVKPRIIPVVTYIRVPGSWEREERPDLPPEYFEPQAPRPDEIMYVSKGHFVSMGGTAFIERLPSGNIVKTPLPHPILYKKYLYEMRLEASIYAKIGSHRSIPQVVEWDPETCCLTMEHMENGNLREYVRENHDNITLERRYQWARQSAEGLSAVHSAGAIHCDISPRNFLLDSDLNLKISDFGGGSLSGSKPTAIYSTRFLPPGYDEDIHPDFKDDIFSLGSVIYFIMTGEYPYEDTPSGEVDKLYESHMFPDITNLSCGIVIQQCWEMQTDTAQEVYHALEALECAQTPNLL